jgi:hypothetical protein
MIEFSRLNSTSRYAYTTRHIIYFDCKQPLFKHYRMIKEEIRPL